ncbi:hypothetical protein K0B04_01725 [Patescibacteria group bacterium]|nr:hypothetical protein [Patescibacteria group bacterium]
MPVYVYKPGRRRKKKRKKLHSGVTPKQYADRSHSRIKAEERYGIELNRPMRLEIKRAIENHQATRSTVGHSTQTRVVYENVVPGHPEIPVVYSHRTNSPVTFKPIKSCNEEKK